MLVAPAVLAHHEVAHRRLRPEAVRKPAQVVVVEIEHERVVVDRRLRAEFEDARLRPAGRGRAVHPGAQHEMRAQRPALPRAREPVEVRRRALDAIGVVVPAAEIQHGGRDLAVAAADFRPVPPGILRRMREPLEVVRRLASQPRQLAERQERLVLTGDSLPGFLRVPFVRHAEAAPRVRGGVLVDPRQPGPVEQARHVEEAARRGERHGGRHGDEVRRLLERGQPLHGARI